MVFFHLDWDTNRLLYSFFPTSHRICSSHYISIYICQWLFFFYEILVILSMYNRLTERLDKLNSPLRKKLVQGIAKSNQRIRASWSGYLELQLKVLGGHAVADQIGASAVLDRCRLKAWNARRRRRVSHPDGIVLSLPGADRSTVR